MFRLALLIALAFLPQDADKEAAELLKKIESKLLAAKTVQLEFEAAPTAADREKMKGEIRLGGGGNFFYKVTVDRGSGKEDTLILRGDGKVVVFAGPMPVDTSAWKPEVLEKYLRGSLAQSGLMGMMAAFSNADLATHPPALENIKSEGTEKIDEINASVVTFTVKAAAMGRTNTLDFRLWIDPKSLAILKRKMTIDGRQELEEKVVRLTFDAPIAAEVLEFRSPALLAKGQEIQVARSVVLFARYTGARPKELGDLKTRPPGAKDAFWPEGGFWIGGKLPDLKFTTDAAGFTIGSLRETWPTYSPVGAPTDRLQKFFAARVRLQLLRAAAEGYEKSTGVMPRTAEDLMKQPDIAKYWPEGGWIGSKDVLTDPWGEAYAVRGGVSFAAKVARSKERTLKAADLSSKEREDLEKVARPAPSEQDLKDLMALAPALGAENLEEREKASRAITAKGVGALRWVKDRLKEEKDPEVVTRLRVIADELGRDRMTWETELKSLFVGLAGPGNGAMLDANERTAMIALKTITTAEADFRANDRDGNGIADFWVLDVGGLWGLQSGTKGVEAAPAKDNSTTLRLIDPNLAKSDATPARWEYPTLAIKEPQPRAGYLVAALKNYEVPGKAEPYHKGNGRHADQFGFVVYPADYGTSGTKTFIVNEDNTIWWQDLQGEEVDTWPLNPAAEGWRKLD